MTTAVPAVVHIPFRQGQLVVHRVGEGPTLGYVHGFIGNPSTHPFVSALAAAASGHSVVAPSLPGFTGSAPCEDLRSLYDWVVAASEVFDLAGLTGAPAVASSLGAMLALEVASIRPDVFSHLVVIAPLGLWDASHPVADPFGTTLSAQRALLTSDPARTAAFFDDDTARSSDELIEDGVVRYLTRTAAAQLVWPIPEFGISTRLHRVTCPVTIVWGAQDQLCGVSYLERWRDALPNVVATHVVDGAGHLAEWDQPEAVADIVASALA